MRVLLPAKGAATLLIDAVSRERSPVSA